MKCHFSNILLVYLLLQQWSPSSVTAVAFKDIFGAGGLVEIDGDDTYACTIILGRESQNLEFMKHFLFSIKLWLNNC
jgi:hypothetical protein